MPTKRKLSLLLPAFALAALLAFPVAAQATLAYVKAPFNAKVFVANDDGSGAKKVGPGHSPRVSPDGNWVAYLHEGAKHAQELKVAPATGGPGRTLMVGFQESFYLAWSPDSTQIAALRGPELGKRNLVVVDVASGHQTLVSQGYFSGFSFSPEGGQLVFARAAKEGFPLRSDVYRIDVLPPGAVSVAAVLPVRISSDRRNLDPLWGPNGQIVVAKWSERRNREYGPRNDLYLMNPAGKAVKRLTHTKVGPLLQGLSPTEWSVDGKRLLAEFGGQDTSYAVMVNPKTGAERPVAGVGETGFVGTDLSSDGKLVLGFNGGFDPGLKNHKVQTVPTSGGKPKTLVKEAIEPSWSR